MKGKKISENITLSCLMQTLMNPSAITNDRKENPSLNTKSKNYIVDTCYTSDTGCYETGISAKNLNDGSWIIVDEYKTAEESEKGHNKWVKYMKTNPKKLTDIHRGETYDR